MAGNGCEAPADKPVKMSVNVPLNDSRQTSGASSVSESPATDACVCNYPVPNDVTAIPFENRRLCNYFFEFVPMGNLNVVHFVFLPNASSTGVPAQFSSLATKLLSRHTLPVIQAFEDAGFFVDHRFVTAFSLVLPTFDGYVAHSNFIKNRLEGSVVGILRIHHPLKALERYTHVKADDNIDLPVLIRGAAAIVQWEHHGKDSLKELQSWLGDISKDLAARISTVDWILPDILPPNYRIALVRGRPNLTTGAEFYAAAEGLGVALVIIDQEGHWLQEDTPENRKYREGFIVTDMTEDDHTAARIVAAVRSYPKRIDGIVTLSDNFFVAVAKANAQLGFRTNPPCAYEISVDKYRSRLLQNEFGKTARVNNVEELRDILQQSVDGLPVFSPEWPMIVKPTKGWSSECVSKVSSIKDLYIAVDKATKRHGSAAVIEPFYNGPEIDANFILDNGKVLFSEIADEPPCSADCSHATVDDTFSPVALTMPSALPLWEQDMVKKTLHNLLLNAGFYTGVFHVEARVTNSTVQYRTDNNILDLYPTNRLQITKPVCRLVEINARPPGYRVTVPARITYGVDYFVAHILAAVGDFERLRVFSKPFAFKPTHNRTSPADYGMPAAGSWTRLVYVPVREEGKIAWREKFSPGTMLKQGMDDVLLSVDYYQEGDHVVRFTDGAETVMGHMLVRGKTRREAIAMGKRALARYYLLMCTM